MRLSVMRDASRPDLCTAYRANGEVIGQFGYRLNGHISTAGSQELTFGVVAARVRFQQPPGQHGALWLQPSVPVPGATESAEGGAEIDVIEWFGAGLPSGGLSGSVYYPTTSGQVKAGGWDRRPRLLPERHEGLLVVELPRLQRGVEPRRLCLPRRRPGDMAHQCRGVRAAGVPHPEPALLRLRVALPNLGGEEQPAAAHVRRLGAVLALRRVGGCIGLIASR